MTGWNCRGLSTSLPYLDHLIHKGSKILVLSEHWLWPNDLHTLNDIIQEFDAIGKADNRLMEEGDGDRGCGGVGMIWHNSIAAIPISGINSDRVCGIRFKMNDDDQSLMSVIGVYLSCLDVGVDCYREHLAELERVISESRLPGPVTALGDFNAHLDAEKCNLQGFLIQELRVGCDLRAVSQRTPARGPAHTYSSGNTRTTVDCVLTDVEAASMITSCVTHDMADLNTSDHLPITACMAYQLDTVSDNHNEGFHKIDWVEAEKCGATSLFASEVRMKLEPLLNEVYNDIEMIRDKIESVAAILQDCAARLLPCIQTKKRKKWKDDIPSGLFLKNGLARASECRVSFKWSTL